MFYVHINSSLEILNNGERNEMTAANLNSYQYRSNRERLNFTNEMSLQFFCQTNLILINPN